MLKTARVQIWHGVSVWCLVIRHEAIALADVSLIGATLPVVYSGLPASLYGTSASAPAFAGLVMRLNAAVRATKGYENCRMGFLVSLLEPVVQVQAACGWLTMLAAYLVFAPTLFPG
jgi:hypothetical protein